MGKLTEYIKNYFETTPEDQLRQDWEELKVYNNQGPNIFDVINNYEQVATETSLDGVSVPISLTPNYTESDLCLAA